eukprot:m.300719 g.300719  ORF g.300719 m.300719 type:complete len:446 (-) comp16422_c0_seq16:3970-5307(-)
MFHIPEPPLSPASPVEAECLDLSGWLRKRGNDSIGAWKERFFVLDETYLSYFTKYPPSEEGRRGSVPTGDIKLARPLDKKELPGISENRGTYFLVICLHRTYLLQAASLDHQRTWVDTLTGVVIRQGLLRQEALEDHLNDDRDLEADVAWRRLSIQRRSTRENSVGKDYVMDVAAGVTPAPFSEVPGSMWGGKKGVSVLQRTDLSTALHSLEIIKYGILAKRGAFHGKWKRRLFVLAADSAAMTYYDGHGVLRGGIWFKSVISIKPKPKSDVSFEIETNGYAPDFRPRVFLLMAGTRVEREDWMKELRGSIERQLGFSSMPKDESGQRLATLRDAISAQLLPEHGGMDCKVVVSINYGDEVGCAQYCMSLNQDAVEVTKGDIQNPDVRIAFDNHILLSVVRGAETLLDIFVRGVGVKWDGNFATVRRISSEILIPAIKTAMERKS